MAVSMPETNRTRSGIENSMYEFTLKFALPDHGADPEQYMDSLFEAGCDDATIGIGKRGAIALNFSRESASAQEAVHSAIANVKKAVPGAELVEITPDIVNLADIADLLGCSRQNLRKYAAGEIKTVKTAFPEPIHSGATSFWHFCEIANWLYRHTELRPNPALAEVARIAASLNLELQRKRIEAM
jgi:hypothetical protein